MGSKRAWRLMAVVALLAGLAALAGCAPQGDAGNRAAQGNSSDDVAQMQGDEVSRAMVAYAAGDDVLFVDQDTQTPYVPTMLDEAVITKDGAVIAKGDLVAGNIVEVTGNGIMLESYPGQYPGIAAVEVTSVGSPADAEQYAALVSEVFAEPDPNEVPAGNLGYRTDLAQVSVALNAYAWEWDTIDANGAPQTVVADGTYCQSDGVLLDGVADARIAIPAEAVVSFGADALSVNVARRPFVDAAVPTVDLQAAAESVALTSGEGEEASFVMEPNYLYEIGATFAQGIASYAFYTLA